MGTIECSQPASKSSWDSQDFGDISMVLKMAHFRNSTGPRWVKIRWQQLIGDAAPHLILTQITQWRHIFALLAICAGNSPVTGEFPTQRPVTWSFDVSLICAEINVWVNNREAGNLRRYRAHYDVTNDTANLSFQPWIYNIKNAHIGNS